MKGTLNRLDNGYMLLVDGIIYATDNDKLSKQNCDEIFGIVDVEELANKYFDEPHPADEPYGAYSGFKDGFEYVMELNKEFQFTKEELVKMLIDFVGFPHDYNEPRGSIAERFVESLQQQTEIEVEIEMEEYLEDSLSHIKGEIPVFKMRYKLDENGCLILKKK